MTHEYEIQLEASIEELTDLASQAASMGIAINRGNMRFRERLVIRIASLAAEAWANNDGDPELLALGYQRRLVLESVLTDFDETVSEVYEQLEVDKAANGW
jgi:hypothetical protein